MTIKNNWTLEEIEEIYNQSFPNLIFQAIQVHREHHNVEEVQFCTLLSVKTGGCPEDCGYCPQSAHHDTGLENEKLMDVDHVLDSAKDAKENGSTRFCMGAAWRDVKDGEEFNKVLEMVRGINDLGMESCVTLGMLTHEQAQRLKESGLTAYNHNLDTSREYYPNIISTRSYDERLETLKYIRSAGITVCSGGIIGMGESITDRLQMIQEFACMEKHPESLPLNVLVRVKGTPMENQEPPHPLELVRLIATSRILMPKSKVRLSAGRTEMTDELQALCFLAGANSIFAGEKLLTTPNPGQTQDHELMESLGMMAETN